MKSLVYNRDGSIIENNEELDTSEMSINRIRHRILELKKLLSSTDWIANKLSEAVAEYIETNDSSKIITLRLKYAKELEDRQSWRDEINRLEEEVAQNERN